MTDNTPATGISKTPRLPHAMYGVPVLLMVAIFLFSPNYRQSDSVRTDPLGGDFLQEYVGCIALWNSGGDAFFDLEAFKKLQHDPAIVGFQWEESGYFPLVYPPFYYAAFTPFTWLPYTMAMACWLVLMTACLVGAIFLLDRFVPGSRETLRWAAPMCVLFIPLINSLNGGQKGTLLLLLLTATWLLLKKEKSFAAGLFFGLLAFKPHLGLLIGGVMLCKRQWKFVLGSLATVTSLVGISFLFGPNLWMDYVHVTLGMGDYVSTKGYDLTDAYSFWGACQLLFGQSMSPLAKVATIILAFGMIAFVATTVRDRFDFPSQRFDLQFAMLVVATVVTSPHLFKYDLTMLLLPMFLQLHTCRESSRSLSECWPMIALFFGVGIAPDIAAITHLQIVVVLMICWLRQLQMQTVSAPSVQTMRLSNDEKPTSSRLANGSANDLPMVQPQ